MAEQTMAGAQCPGQQEPGDDEDERRAEQADLAWLQEQLRNEQDREHTHAY